MSEYTSRQYVFMFGLNGEDIITDLCVCVPRGRESYLTIADVVSAFSRVEISCESSNVVEDRTVSEVATQILTVFGEQL